MREQADASIPALTPGLRLSFTDAGSVIRIVSGGRVRWQGFLSTPTAPLHQQPEATAWAAGTAAPRALGNAPRLKMKTHRWRQTGTSSRSVTSTLGPPAIQRRDPDAESMLLFRTR